MAGKWTAGRPSVLAAICGMGDDPYGGPDGFADPMTPEQARACAAERGIDLFAENADSPQPAGGRLGSPTRRALVFGALCAGVGLIIGTIFSLGAEGDGYRWLPVAAALAAFGSGAALWRALPELLKRRPHERSHRTRRREVVF